MVHFDHVDAPVAVQYRGYTPLSVPGGMFSTADPLSEDRLAVGGSKAPTVNLNQAVQQILVTGSRASGVSCWISSLNVGGRTKPSTWS